MTEPAALPGPPPPGAAALPGPPRDEPTPVDAALAALRSAAGAPLPERPALLESVHARLAAALGTLDGS